MLVLSLTVRWLECTLHIGMSLMLMITMVKNLLTMSEGFGWQRYKKYIYPPQYLWQSGDTTLVCIRVVLLNWDK